MAVHLKPLGKQTILITGASSGIGLVTARMAAARGAAVMLVARDEESLREAADSIRAAGGRAAFHVADVADAAALEAAADAAEREVGPLDSWVNDAGVSTIGTLAETPIEDQRRLFETNYWGVVHGSLIAAKRLREKGGAIVNIGSVLSDRAMIYQGAYSASKHAVKGFTDALRMELEAARAPISVTLVKPASIGTPYAEHARLEWGQRSVKLPPPVYDPQLVARAICFACTHARRDLYVGGGGAAIALAGALFPRLTDYAMERVGKPAQTTEVAGRAEMRDNLEQHRPGAERSALPGQPSRRSSLLLEAQLHPVATLATIAGAGALALGALTAAGASRRAGMAMRPGWRRAMSHPLHLGARRRGWFG